MSKHNRPFVFKQFEVEHCCSSMKVGIDAVVLGAWACMPMNATNVLDVGCGCGVISMMIAQRYSDVKIEGIDIDEASVVECGENFRKSPWKDRLNVKNEDFLETNGKYDYIISNPPYFADGLKETDSIRLVARHQGRLSPEVLLKKGSRMLKEKGRIGIVVPYTQTENLMRSIEGYDIKPVRIMLMAGTPELEFKRSFIEFEKSKEGWKADFEEDLMGITQKMFVENIEGGYSNDYKKLCKEFYLKF